MTKRETVERERWLLAVEGPAVRDLVEFLRTLPGRRAVAAEVDPGDVVDAEAA